MNSEVRYVDPRKIGPDTYSFNFPPKPSWIHLVYPKCNCPHCREVRGEPPKVPAMRAEDV
jgi:hypothetical protein